MMQQCHIVIASIGSTFALAFLVTLRYRPRYIVLLLLQD